ncbi:hypothetical protein MMYC01_209131 [Madurella mycetomatis]|uniref:Fungal N-terminal domain-containing protein n=1 Tax=Madurella mycetomatis TaxID=100816 RepID=A0A175VQF7_9PEZI|nr:hypothetical protein MMYC01_209131 [Madurella mycetomatis]
MAEALGVVASGIAIGHAAQTVGGAVLFLSRLWFEVKEVPETIQDILKELELTGHLVDTIQDEFEPAAGGSLGGDASLTSVQCLAIQRCRQAHKDLRDLVGDLAADIASSRRGKRFLTKAKVVLKKDALDHYERRLHRAQRFLDSAVQTHIAPPKWLLNRAWDLQLSMASSGWTAVFRQYIVVPISSQVIHAIYDGSLADLMELFDKGLASPFSTTPDGWTLLHRGLLEPLIQMGLDTSARNSTGQMPLDLVTTKIYLDETGTREVAVHRLMLSKGAYDEIAICEAPWSAGDSYGYIWIPLQMMANVEVFESFLINVFPNFYQWPLARRLDVLIYGLMFTPHHKVIGSLFRPDGRFRPEDLYCQTPNGTTFWQEISEWRWNNMRCIIRDIVRLTSPSDFNAETHEGLSTILLVNIRRWRWDPVFGCPFLEPNAIFPLGPWKGVLKWYMRGWLEDLLAGGKDLELYGRMEMAAFLRQDKLRSECWPPQTSEYWSHLIPVEEWDYMGSSEGGWRWQGFTYGPRPEDWDLIWEWDPRVEEFVGDFWSWIENPPLRVPGAWVD